jgi:hypothetical protein
VNTKFNGGGGGQQAGDTGKSCSQVQRQSAIDLESADVALSKAIC